MEESRRKFVLGTGASALLLGCMNTHASSPEASSKEGEGKISPPEDLMREHGVLNRILLVYEESVRRIGSEQDVPTTLDVVATSAKIIRGFIEQYHEKLEEDFLFPRFEKANTLVDLVGTLRRQHRAGRELTATVIRIAGTAGDDQERRRVLSNALQAFVRMYRPHEAREDTILFPGLRRVVKPAELDALGEQFEDKEHALFGKEGFEGVVAEVAKLEQRLGIYDLNLFTPEVLGT